MKIGGWQRLWILSAVIYLIVIVGFVANTYPKPEDIRHSQDLYDKLPPEFKNKILQEGKGRDLSDLSLVMEALRNADAAGNIEDAQKLAIIADKLRKEQARKRDLINECKGRNLIKEARKPDLRNEAIRRGLIKKVEMANGHIMMFMGELPEKEIDAVAKEYWNVVEKLATKNLINYLGFAFLWWLLPVFALYGFGWSIGWVYRGFRK